ncbi:MAG: ANTAR domain-containing protein [Acidimicrobiales bacterium]
MNDASPLSRFGIGVTFEDAEVVVAAIGKVDIVTAADLGDIVNAVIDRGHSSVVLDLSRCTLLDASGLAVISTVARRLSLLPLGKMLVLRSPSAPVARILAVTGLDEVVTIDEQTARTSNLGREQSTGGMTAGNGFDVEVGARPLRQAHSPDIEAHSPDIEADSLREVTAIAADRDVVDGALRLVVALARATVEGADGVSVSLERYGSLATVAASDQTILAMDADQYATGEGPCVDASVKGRWFHVESLDDETRWPAFVPKARTLGINAILSSPLLVDERPVGALNIYSNTPGAFEVKDERLAALFASEASTILADSGATVSDGHLATRLVGALRSRELISQAQGILMERDGVSADGAFTYFLELSRRSNRSIRELAEELVVLARGPEGADSETSRTRDD